MSDKPETKGRFSSISSPCNKNFTQNFTEMCYVQSIIWHYQTQLSLNYVDTNSLNNWEIILSQNPRNIITRKGLFKWNVISYLSVIISSEFIPWSGFSKYKFLILFCWVNVSTELIPRSCFAKCRCDGTTLLSWGEIFWYSCVIFFIDLIVTYVAKKKAVNQVLKNIIDLCHKDCLEFFLSTMYISQDNIWMSDQFV